MTVPTNESAVWASDGEFKMSSERARELAWIATGGQTGVIGPESLEVKAQSTPDGTVRILPGAFAAQATPGGTAGTETGYTTAPWQSYLRAIHQTTDVAITPTDSSGSRTDVVGLEIVDPVYEGTVDTVDWETHDFWRTRVIENADPDTNMVDHFATMKRPFIPLARVTIPASTGTITDDMITDQRFLAVERSHSVPIIQQPESDHAINQGDNRSLGVAREAIVPQWATHVVIDAELAGVRLSGEGWARGNTKIGIIHPEGTNPMTDAIMWRNSEIRERFELPVAGTVALPRQRRGKPLRIWFEVTHAEGDATLRIWKDVSAQRVRLTFQERPTKS